VKEIVIDVSDDGEVKIETRGFTGKACIQESQFLKDLLGKEISQRLTPAYYTTHQKEKVKKHLPLCG
jgi:stress-induced morphogen